VADENIMARATTDKDLELCPDLIVYVGRVSGAEDDGVLTALAATGVQVRRVESTEEADACVRYLPVRMLVVGLDGEGDHWRLIRKAAACERQIPVVCVSATATRSRVLGAVRRGARSYLVSPLSADQVRASLVPLLADGPPQDEPSQHPASSVEELAS
jgi:DNA-binding NtrC family response regulator